MTELAPMLPEYDELLLARSHAVNRRAELRAKWFAACHLVGGM
jgi:hypothetical protein